MYSTLTGVGTGENYLSRGAAVLVLAVLSLACQKKPVAIASDAGATAAISAPKAPMPPAAVPPPPTTATLCGSTLAADWADEAKVFYVRHQLEAFKATEVQVKKHFEGWVAPLSAPRVIRFEDESGRPMELSTYIPREAPMTSVEVWVGEKVECTGLELAGLQQFFDACVKRAPRPADARSLATARPVLVHAFEANDFEDVRRLPKSLVQAMAKVSAAEWASFGSALYPKGASPCWGSLHELSRALKTNEDLYYQLAYPD